MQEIKDILKNKDICILGYGREGRSTLNWLRTYFYNDIKSLTIADQNPAALHGEELAACGCNIRYGYDYLAGLEKYELIIKSPGINLIREGVTVPEEKLTSQTDLFLCCFAGQSIGVTGTKGKSTTSTLLYEMLRRCGKETRLLGNIGEPPLDSWNEITDDMVIILELSSHQLEYIRKAPAVALLLNLFQEHLDHYRDFRHYQLAKFNITARQKPGDLLITHYADTRIQKLLDESDLRRKMQYFSLEKHGERGMYQQGNRIMYVTEDGSDIFMNPEDIKYLSGRHNILNVMAASLAALSLECSKKALRDTIFTFRHLEHRMELVREHKGVSFYNDAIATIPEATMAAAEALRNVGTLIMGGFDRGIDYNELAAFLLRSGIDNLVFMGEAGESIFQMMQKEQAEPAKNILFTEDMEEAVQFAVKHTRAGKSCLLSPAAASYDRFNSYAEKGTLFKYLVLGVE